LRNRVSPVPKSGLKSMNCRELSRNGNSTPEATRTGISGRL
jgi:hypothetical protein